ncbi:MAG: hypothetical protein HKL96_06840 [Phycisphaerales bacterium]|nr:hypothetical protein [Phycisphaerales bacterium]
MPLFKISWVAGVLSVALTGALAQQSTCIAAIIKPPPAITPSLVLKVASSGDSLKSPQGALLAENPTKAVAAIKKALLTAPTTERRTLQKLLLRVEINRVSQPTIIHFSAIHLPALQVVQQCCNQADGGTPFVMPAIPSLKRIMSLPDRKLSFWQAMVDMAHITGCSPAGLLHSIGPTAPPQGIDLKKHGYIGKHEPYCVAGPYLLLIKSIAWESTQNLQPAQNQFGNQANSPTLTIHIKVLTEPKSPIPAPGNDSFNYGSFDPQLQLNVVRATDQNNKSLLTPQQPGNFADNDITRDSGPFDGSCLLMLNLSGKAPKSIRHLSGFLLRPLLIGNKVWTIDNINNIKERTHQASGFSIVLGKVIHHLTGKYTIVALVNTMTFQGPQFQSLSQQQRQIRQMLLGGQGAIMYDKSGHAYRLTAQSTMAFNDSSAGVRFDLRLAGENSGLLPKAVATHPGAAASGGPVGPPIRLVWKLPQGVVTPRITFAFHNIPVPQP